MATYRTGVATWTTTNQIIKTATIVTLPGDLLVVVSGWSGHSEVGLTDDQVGGTYTRVVTGFQDTTFSHGIAVSIRDNLVTTGASTIVSSDQQGANNDGGGLAVLAISGMNQISSDYPSIGGSLAVRSFGNQDQVASGTPAPVLSMAPLRSNMIIGAIMTGSNSSANVVPRTGYTERFDQGYNNPASGLEVMTLNSGETNPTITWGGAAASTFGSVVVELDCPQPFDDFTFPTPDWDPAGEFTAATSSTMVILHIG